MQPAEKKQLLSLLDELRGVVEELLLSGPTAPPHGLFLQWIQTRKQPGPPAGQTATPALAETEAEDA